jgi:hypothetical protein
MTKEETKELVGKILTLLEDVQLTLDLDADGKDMDDEVFTSWVELRELTRKVDEKNRRIG